MAWHKWLSLVGALAGVGVGTGAAVLMLTGCTPGTGTSPRITKENPFPFMPEQEVELCGTKRLAEIRDWSLVRFGEPLGFNRAGETIDATAYATVTFLDGRVFGGKYAMQATFIKGDSGGPAGSVTEYSVEVEGVHLLERMVKPQAPAGVQALLPGEFVIRKIPDGELMRVNERYVVELPANKRATVDFDPWPVRFEPGPRLVLVDPIFQVSVSKDGVLVPAPFTEELKYGVTKLGYRFDTGTGGLFGISIRGIAPTGKIPDRYQFYVGWGDSLGRLTGIADRWAELKDPPTPGRKSSNQNKQ